MTWERNPSEQPLEVSLSTQLIILPRQNHNRDSCSNARVIYVAECNGVLSIAFLQGQHY